jgi:hypothetical protein
MENVIKNIQSIKHLQHKLIKHVTDVWPFYCTKRDPTVFRTLWRPNLFLATEHPPDFQYGYWKGTRIASLFFNNNLCI